MQQHTGLCFQGNTGKTYLHPAAGKQNNTYSVLKVQSHFVLSSELWAWEARPQQNQLLYKPWTWRLILCGFAPFPSHSLHHSGSKPPSLHHFPRNNHSEEFSSGREHADGSLASLIPLGWELWEWRTLPPLLRVWLKKHQAEQTDEWITWLILAKNKAEKQKDAKKNPFSYTHMPVLPDTDIDIPKHPSGWLTTADVQECVRRPLNLQLICDFPQNHEIPQMPSHLTAPFPRLRFLNNLPSCLKSLPLFVHFLVEKLWFSSKILIFHGNGKDYQVSALWDKNLFLQAGKNSFSAVGAPLPHAVVCRWWNKCF